jgi:hypothetical protein
MTPRRKVEPVTAAATEVQQGAQRWLLFVHQLPSSSSNLRVRTWRRLQQLGAIPIKQAVYVLPDTTSAREDFEWLKAEVKASELLDQGVVRPGIDVVGDKHAGIAARRSVGRLCCRCSRASWAQGRRSSGS